MYEYNYACRRARCLLNIMVRLLQNRRVLARNQEHPEVRLARVYSNTVIYILDYKNLPYFIIKK